MAGPDYTAIELLTRLVAFDTTSHKSNFAIIAFIEDYLLQHGVRSHRVVDESGEKACLYATIGPEHTAGVALSGHTDVVPVDGQAWNSDPFTLRQENGKLYGRGASRMAWAAPRRCAALASWARLPSSRRAARSPTPRDARSRRRKASWSAATRWRMKRGGFLMLRFPLSRSTVPTPGAV